MMRKASRLPSSETVTPSRMKQMRMREAISWVRRRLMGLIS